MPSAIFPIGKAEILTGFPERLTPMTRETMLGKLICVLMHFIQCSLAVFTETSPLNYPFLVLNKDVYKAHTTTPLSYNSH